MSKEIVKGTIIEWIKAAIIALGLYLILNIFIFSAKVDGLSMYPTLNDKDFLIALSSNINKEYNYEDIIVFYSENRGHLLIKRVIGLPGDHIEIKNKEVYRNNVKLKESYIDDIETDGNIDVIVAENHLFVLGDNRPNSADSRLPEIGQIDVNDIKGKVLFRVYPKPKKF